MCESKSKTREELFTYILAELEDMGDISYVSKSGGIFTKDNLLRGLSISPRISSVFFEMGFSSKTGYNKAMSNKLGTDFLSYKIYGEHWDTFLLRMFDFRYCPHCERCHSIDYFPYGNNSYCNTCENTKQASKRKDTRKHIINVCIREGFDTECSICGYDTNWGALEFHHKDSGIERPEWAKGGNPSSYILLCGQEEAERRFLVEKDNLELLCRNCHQDIHFMDKPTKNRQEGLRQALSILGNEYICSVDGCNEDTYLHLHHNNPAEKQYSFGSFRCLSMDKILKDGLLESELNKDVVILCGNHHKEIHNPNLFMDKLIGGNNAAS